MDTDPRHKMKNLKIILLYIYTVTVTVTRGASQDFIKKYPKNTDISPILGIKFSTKIVQKGYDFIFRRVVFILLIKLIILLD